ncbi:MAG: HD domain-containing phosphohydrolase [Gammaproteobacteria bacterium]|jgi:HD-GYP domain-containing protein (c-di-GMP phosphodiesterase class II)|nr:HD domain-containing phosphohydrolase [Gammaproteobacteria bacterium]MDP6652087.1 HD domain-containing phosphohydrolase [Gammaproteobacteria bacterium]|tara:strand:- start:388 stop:702 length:315 start_codon:yes stop_codon:yes gene_type:complete
MLQHIDFPWPVTEIVLQHHEHFDGTGYPNGLAEWEILDEARILLVADAVEAITTKRPYRAASSLKDAVREISSKSGSLYDPDVVDALTQLASSDQLTIGGSSWE